MNRLRQALDKKERSVSWAAKKRGITRSGLLWKIVHDVFDEGDKQFYSELLDRPRDEIFPEPDPAPEAA